MVCSWDIETHRDVKTSFKNDHVVNLANRKNNIRSVHIIRAVVTKENGLKHREPRRKFGYATKRFKIQEASSVPSHLYLIYI